MKWLSFFLLVCFQFHLFFSTEVPSRKYILSLQNPLVQVKTRLSFLFPFSFTVHLPPPSVQEISAADKGRRFKAKCSNAPSPLIVHSIAHYFTRSFCWPCLCATGAPNIKRRGYSVVSWTLHHTPKQTVKQWAAESPCGYDLINLVDWVEAD